MSVEASGRDWQQYAINLKARAEAAEAERDEIDEAAKRWRLDIEAELVQLRAERDKARLHEVAANDRMDEIWAEKQAAEAEVARLRGEIEDYMLWEPGRAGHAAAHARLRAALADKEGT